MTKHTPFKDLGITSTPWRKDTPPTDKKDNDIVIKAISFATRKHRNQIDDNGKPYIIHPSQVAKIMMTVTNDQNLIAAAYLHDTLEDTNTTYEDLVLTFNQDVADLVNEVTHEGTKEEGYYFPRLHSQRGIMLKLADRLSNISRMETWSEERKAHYLKKTKFWKGGDDI